MVKGAEELILFQIKTFKRILLKLIFPLILLALICIFIKNNDLYYLMGGSIVACVYFVFKIKKFESVLVTKKVYVLQKHIDNLIYFAPFNYIVSEIGIVSLRNLDVIEYYDILKIKKYSKFFGGKWKQYIILYTKNRKKYRFMIKATNSVIPFKDFSEIIIQKNPTVEFVKKNGLLNF